MPQHLPDHKILKTHQSGIPLNACRILSLTHWSIYPLHWNLEHLPVATHQGQKTMSSIDQASVMVYKRSGDQSPF